MVTSRAPSNAATGRLLRYSTFCWARSSCAPATSIECCCGRAPRRCSSWATTSASAGRADFAQGLIVLLIGAKAVGV